MKICVLNIATNGYEKYMPALYKGLKEKFLTNHEVSTLVFTDQDSLPFGDRTVKIASEPWPFPTLHRYHYFHSEREYLSQFDYCFYFDVDMLVNRTITDEILGKGLTACLHPVDTLELVHACDFDYERNSLSTAAVGYEEGKYYYMGGFNGGTTSDFLEMCRVLHQRVDKDSENGIIAKWHDESHLNRYLIDNPPDVILGVPYCTTDGDPNREYASIIAVSKGADVQLSKYESMMRFLK